MRSLLWWRHLALAALAAGLAASRALAPPPAWAATAIGAAILLVATDPRRRGGGALAAATWLTLLAAAATLAGLGLGGLRLDAIAAGAAPGSPGERVHATGHVAAPARASLGELRIPLQTADGRLLLVTPDRAQLPDPAIGDRLAVVGTLAEPEPWRAAELERVGAGLELRAERVRPLPGRRGGLPGLLDRARAKAERGVAAGLDPGEEALARGFVLGQDDRIDERTREQFRRSGLAHLLSCYAEDKTPFGAWSGEFTKLVRREPSVSQNTGWRASSNLLVEWNDECGPSHLLLEEPD